MGPTLDTEAADLEALKSNLNNPTTPPLETARALESYLSAYPQSPAELGDKIGKSRSWVIQMVGFLKLPPDVLAQAEKDKAGFRDLQMLQAAIRPANNENNNANSFANSANNENNSANSLANRPPHSANNANNENNNANSLPPAYPLLRDTVNAISRLAFFWVKEPELGQVTERWAIRVSQVGGLRVTLSIAYFGLAVLGAWHLKAILQPKIRHLWGLIQTGIPAGKGVLSATQAVHLTGSRWISGHRLELRWTPAAADSRYQVYWESETGDSMRALGQPVKSPGAIISANSVWGKGMLSVTSINPQDEESAHSERVAFTPTPLNEQDSVEPLPLPAAHPTQSAGRTHPIAPSATVVSPALPPLTPPVEVHADVKTPDLIRITWRAVGWDVRYNVYSSASRELTALRRENDHPLKSNTVDWTPETGLPRYWIVVTALDSQDRESAYSEAIEVVRHPETSGSNAAADTAAGVLRKILPW